ncbi:MAG: glycosyltransferase family 2 protein [Pseudomonadota bacterium]
MTGTPTKALPRVAAVIVAYHPDPSVLRGLIEAVRPQVSRLTILNNGSPHDMDAFATMGDLSILSFERNLGIGEAVGHAAREAADKGYEFLLTLDQDSIPAPDMVEKLLEAYRTLSAQGLLVGCVGPRQIDRRSGHGAPFIAPIHGWRLRRKKITPSPNQTLQVDHLITSGLLAPVSLYEAAGMPRSDLFIDYVDIEWSLRVRHLGFELYAVEQARLYHSIGDSYLNIAGRQIPVHSPLRNYYLMRNGVFLQTLSYIPRAWRFSDALQLLKKFIFFSVFLDQRGKRVRMMLAGIRDGFRGRLGIFREPR